MYTVFIVFVFILSYGVYILKSLYIVFVYIDIHLKKNYLTFLFKKKLFSGYKLWKLHPFLNLSPRMCIKQTTLAHCLIHLFESGNWYRIAQFIRFKIRSHRWIKETDKSSFAIFSVFNGGLCHHCATARTKGSYDTIMCIIIKESPSCQS